MVIEHIGRPRVGLLGNPSDLYRGRVLGFTFQDFAARARLVPARETVLIGPDGTRLGVFDAENLLPRDCAEAHALMAAALCQLHQHAPDRVNCAAMPFHLEVTSDIPRQVGLSGSSAIVIACLRALAEHFQVPLSDFVCAELALAAETIQLAQVAGPQDRVLQSYEGSLYMDFSEPRRDDRYQRVSIASLPEMLVAYDPSPGENSGALHSDVHALWRSGDPRVRAGIAVFSELAAAGLDHLRSGRVSALCDCMDANFRARQSLWQVAEADRNIASIARDASAGAKLCGSGGALVILPRPNCQIASLRTNLESTGWRVLTPAISS